jgi:hypothetical protein
VEGERWFSELIEDEAWLPCGAFSTAAVFLCVIQEHDQIIKLGLFGWDNICFFRRWRLEKIGTDVLAVVGGLNLLASFCLLYIQVT